MWIASGWPLLLPWSPFLDYKLRSFLGFSLFSFLHSLVLIKFPLLGTTHGNACFGELTCQICQKCRILGNDWRFAVTTSRSIFENWEPTKHNTIWPFLYSGESGLPEFAFRSQGMFSKYVDALSGSGYEIWKKNMEQTVKFRRKFSQPELPDGHLYTFFFLPLVN